MSVHHADGSGYKEREQDDIPRRGLLAWAAMLAGAGLAWLTGMRSAEATHVPGGGGAGSDSLALHVDQLNQGVQRTFLVANVPM